MKKLNFNLSEKSINELIQKLESVKPSIEQAKQESVKEVAEEAINVIIETMATDTRAYPWGKIDTGELAQSTHIEEEQGKVKIIQEGENAFAVEFGDGAYFEPSDYPDSSIIPGDMPKNKPSSNGYYTYEPKPNSVHWNETRNGQNVARGQMATAQMYHGKEFVQIELPARVIEKVRDKLSKI